MASDNFNLPGDEKLTPAEMLMAMITPSEHLHMAVATFGTFTLTSPDRITMGDTVVPNWREQVVNDLIKIMKVQGSSAICTEITQLCSIAIALLIEERNSNPDLSTIDDEGNPVGNESPADFLRGMADKYPGEELLNEYREGVNRIRSEGQIEQLNNLFNLPSAEESDA